MLELGNILEMQAEAWGQMHARLREAALLDRANPMAMTMRIGAQERPLYEVNGNVAVINIAGPLSKGDSFWSSLFGWPSYARTSKALNAAVADEKVQSVVMVIDSPGGAAMGGSDMADAIVSAKASSGKRVEAFIQDLGASAAYRMASQTDRITANRGALVGSIGTYMVLYDVSRMFENEGIQAVVIRDGKFKGAGEFGTKITDEQKTEFEREIASLSATFRSDVARGRKMSDARVRELADGRVHIASEAKGLGLIDEVSSLGAVIARLQAEGEKHSTSGVRRNAYAGV